MQTVLETKAYQAAAEKLLNEDDRDQIAIALAHNPTAGTLIPGGNGIRKLRVALEGRGKRGGARVIYYYHDENVPLFLLYLYAKNEREDLTAAELAVWADGIASFKRSLKRKSLS